MGNVHANLPPPDGTRAYTRNGHIWFMGNSANNAQLWLHEAGHVVDMLEGEEPFSGVFHTLEPAALLTERRKPGVHGGGQERRLRNKRLCKEEYSYPGLNRNHALTCYSADIHEVRARHLVHGY